MRSKPDTTATALRADVRLGEQTVICTAAAGDPRQLHLLFRARPRASAPALPGPYSCSRQMPGDRRSRTKAPAPKMSNTPA